MRGKDQINNLSADNAMLRRQIGVLAKDNGHVLMVNNDLTLYIAALVLRDLKNGVTTKITHEELQALHNRRVAISTIALPRQDLKEKGDNFFDREIIVDLVEVEQEVAPIIQTATEADLDKIQRESKVIEIASR
jgi:hypothetical protein